MFDIAKKHLHEGRLDAAAETAAKILAANPDHHETLHLLGLVHWRRGDLPGAIEHIERAIALPGAGATYYSDVAEMCRVEGRLDSALNHCKRAVTLEPNNADAHYNLGLIHYDRGELDEAIICERRAIELKPDYASAHFELGEALLFTGQFREGWEEYEWAWKVPGVPRLIPPEIAAERNWRGEPLDDKTLLVIADQGFGDVIQFMRYIPRVVERCRDLIIACGIEVKPLIAQMLERIPKPVHVFQVWKEAPAFDHYMALSSLPRLFRTELDTIPDEIPYLRADPERLEHWRQRLQVLTMAGHKRIGLVWAGRPEHLNDRSRSIALNELAPLAELDDVTLVSLQKGNGAKQIGSYYGAAPFINLGPEIKDFTDTAAIIANLDLVIAVDTSVAHLTGALGRRCAILLPFAPDWRWLQHRSDSPWYPSLRLYRQPQPKDWQSVISALVCDLRERPGLLFEPSSDVK
jgi:hypothetical protein